MSEQNTEQNNNNNLLYGGISLAAVVFVALIYYFFFSGEKKPATSTEDVKQHENVETTTEDDHVEATTEDPAVQSEASAFYVSWRGVLGSLGGFGVTVFAIVGYNQWGSFDIAKTKQGISIVCGVVFSKAGLSVCWHVLISMALLGGCAWLMGIRGSIIAGIFSSESWLTSLGAIIIPVLGSSAWFWYFAVKAGWKNVLVYSLVTVLLPLLVHDVAYLLSDNVPKPLATPQVEDAPKIA